ncbi:ABC transporter ATP-binding protein [Rothia sp. P7208]|uniref:ABC transporter ATP-binding protein n=1 Tax=Rothia sp. P7208 TaxID=3402660 RepID=UPI003AC72047
MALLTTTHLHFGFTPTQPILEDINLSLDTHQAITLNGPNGAGKSTLLNLIAGALQPTGGEITLAGHPPHSIEGRRTRWHMSTQPALFRLLTVREQLEFYCAAYGTDPAAALDLLQKLVPEDITDQLCAQISSGQAQKVWFVATIAVHQAPLLLLDEPFSTIDIDSVPLMIDILETERLAGRSIILITHTHQHLLPNTWLEKDIRSLNANHSA